MVNFKQLNYLVDGRLPLQDYASEGVAGHEKKCQVWEITTWHFWSGAFYDP